MGSPAWFLYGSGTSSNPQDVNSCAFQLGLGSGTPLLTLHMDLVLGTAFCFFSFPPLPGCWAVLRLSKFNEALHSPQCIVIYRGLPGGELRTGVHQSRCSLERVVVCRQYLKYLLLQGKFEGRCWFGCFDFVFFLWTQCCHLHFYQSNSLPAGQLPV